MWFGCRCSLRMWVKCRYENNFITVHIKIMKTKERKGFTNWRICILAASFCLHIPDTCSFRVKYHLAELSILKQNAFMVLVSPSSVRKSVALVPSVPARSLYRNHLFPCHEFNPILNLLLHHPMMVTYLWAWKHAANKKLNDSNHDLMREIWNLLQRRQTKDVLCTCASQTSLKSPQKSKTAIHIRKV